MSIVIDIGWNLGISNLSFGTRIGVRVYQRLYFYLVMLTVESSFIRTQIELAPILQSIWSNLFETLIELAPILESIKVL